MDDLRVRIFNYKLAMSIANQLFNEGTLSKEEYERIDTMMTNKYGLSLCSIFREKEPYMLDNN